LVDPDTRTIATADLLIENQTIKAIGPEATRLCKGKTLDLKGDFVLPGLIDLHVHPWGNPAPTGESDDEEPGREDVLRLSLRAGVMAVLDLTGGAEAVALRSRLATSPDHARLFVGAALFRPGRPRGRTGPKENETADAMRTRVQNLARMHPDVLKVIGPGPLLGAVVDEGRRLGLRTIVHIDSWADAELVVASGASVITHLEDEVTIPEPLVAAARKAGTAFMPTMAVQCDLGLMAQIPALLDVPLLMQVTTPRLRAAYRRRADYTQKAQGWVGWQQDGCRQHDFVSLRRLHTAGAPLLVGSDTGNLGTFQGYSVHRELALWVQAGIPTWDALRGATTLAADFLGTPWGLRPGAPANLLVLTGSPVKDISNTMRIKQRIFRGRALP
jgi:imidazolonepropionase-like amidohydrolase